MATARARLPWLTRAWAFYTKEISEVRRQPLLIVSLVGGPLLVLILFGASFQNSNPVLRAAVVLPPGGIPGVDEAQIRALAGLNFELLAITEDRARVEGMLRDGRLDVVQVFPADPYGAVQRGESPEIVFLSNAINPLDEGWIQYLAYAQVNEINKEILRRQTLAAQDEAEGVRLKLADAQDALRLLERALTREQERAALERLAELRRTLALFAAALPPEGAVSDPRGELREVRRQVAVVEHNLDLIEGAIAGAPLDQRRAEVASTQAEIVRLEEVIRLFVRTSPDVIVSPLQQRYINLRGQAYAAVIYYAPGVLALLIQHSAVTLGSLALVRERLMGALEIFRVAPVNMAQLLAGKFLGYTLFIGAAVALLAVALRLLGVPLLGSPWQFVALTLLLIAASLGLGFLISTVSGSDSQAIQLSMITLLLSIFFSGFFIALTSFAPPALAVSYALPMTHGVAGFRDLMLRGATPPALTWGALVAQTALSLALVTAMTRRQLRRA
ncbi:MAG TPA: ABC transporter permease [Roseiflexaceae bacterium]|nr:ABC transporter permease [Roseiflexaceae bacterium]